MRQTASDGGLPGRLLWLAVAGAVASLAGALGHYNLFFDLISNFRIQYIAGIALLLPLALLLRQFIALPVLLVVLAIHVYAALPYWPRAQSTARAPDFRAMTCNLYTENQRHADVIRYIERTRADVVVLQEYSNQWHEALQQTLAPYRYRVIEQLDNAFSIALFSMHPLHSDRVVVYSGSGVPSIEAGVTIDQRSLQVIGTHPWSPEREWSFRDRNRQLQAIASVAAAQDGPVLVLGDMNIAPWSVHFQTLLRDGALRDAKLGFGLMPTWPAGYFPLMITIDHILVNDQLGVVDMRASEYLGSDHLCLSADLVWAADAQ